MTKNAPSQPQDSGKVLLRLEPYFYTVQQTCLVLNIGKTKLFELLRTNRLTFAKVDRRTLILRSSVDAFIQKSIVNAECRTPSIKEGV